MKSTAICLYLQKGSLHDVCPGHKCSWSRRPALAGVGPAEGSRISLSQLVSVLLLNQQAVAAESSCWPKTSIAIFSKPLRHFAFSQELLQILFTTASSPALHGQRGKLHLLHILVLHSCWAACDPRVVIAATDISVSPWSLRALSLPPVSLLLQHCPCLSFGAWSTLESKTDRGTVLVWGVG